MSNVAHWTINFFFQYIVNIVHQASSRSNLILKCSRSRDPTSLILKHTFVLYWNIILKFGRHTWIETLSQQKKSKTLHIAMAKEFLDCAKIHERTGGVPCTSKVVSSGCYFCRKLSTSVLTMYLQRPCNFKIAGLCVSFTTHPSLSGSPLPYKSSLNTVPHRHLKRRFCIAFPDRYGATRYYNYYSCNWYSKYVYPPVNRPTVTFKEHKLTTPGNAIATWVLNTIRKWDLLLSVSKSSIII